MPYAPTLTASVDGNPSPRVLAAFTSLASGTQTLNVYRVAEGRQWPVRGGVKLFAVGGVAVLDLEVPIGVPAVYRAEMFDSSGNSLGFTDSATVTLPTSTLPGPFTRAWIHQPLKPTLAVQCTLLAGSAASIVRESPHDVFYPEGATVGLSIGTQRRGIKGMPMKVLTDNAADADEFQAMFGGYTSDFPAIVCIRTTAPLRLPRTFFAAVDPTEIMLGRAAALEFDFTADEVRPPAPGLVIPTLRRADIDAAYATRGARAAAYATRLARDTDFTKAGLAG